MSSDNLYQIIYISKSKEGFGNAEMRAALPAIRANNAKQNVTGILLSDRGEYLQVLEGPEENVKRIFASIQGDDHHENVVVLREERIKKRRFADWTMGFSEVSVDDIDDPALNDFYFGGSCYSQLKPGWEKVFLTSFMQGHWPKEVA